ncbi:MAG: peptidylprolyl isomerase [Planctomycetota bacterium]
MHQLRYHLLLAIGSLLVTAERSTANTFVRLEYNLAFNAANAALDTVFIELFDDRPLSRDNFLAYVNAGRYDGTFYHRLAPGFVLQGGGFLDDQVVVPSLSDQLAVPVVPNDLDGNPLTDNPTVNNEFNNAPFRSNLRGTIAYAKLGGDPDSATNQYFFNLNDNSGEAPNGLDFQNGGFTVFGEVVGNGMTLIDAFAGLGTLNLNGDANADGFRDPGAFDNVPVVGNQFDNLRIVTERASVVTYFGDGSTVNLPANFVFTTGPDAFVDVGAEFLGNGNLQIVAGTSVGVAGDVTLQQPLRNRGTLAPGLQLGRLDLLDLRQFDTGVLQMQLGGVVAGDTHDLIIASDFVDLDGELEVTLVAGFEPSAGDSFTLIQADSLFGDFATLDLPDLDPSLVWDLDVDTVTDEVVLHVLGGDYNGDMVIDELDLEVWKQNFGATGTGLAGDGNFDEVVDGADYAIWRNSLAEFDGVGTPTPAPANSAITGTPEPATALLSMVAAAFAGVRRRRA